MKIKAIIYDLDNTIYPVSAIGDKLFAPLFQLIEQSGQHNEDMDAIKFAIMRTPFRLVAQRYNLSNELTQSGINLQENLEYHEAIQPFEDYHISLQIPAERFLVTTGFYKMQHSKIRQMGIEADFKELHVVDPTKSNKKEVFEDILNRYSYAPGEVLVVGDDPESEIAAAKSLGIPTVLYDKSNLHNAEEADFYISHFKDFASIFDSF